MHCALASSTPTMISLCLRVQSDSARSGPTSTGLSFWLQKFWAQDWRDGLEVKGTVCSSRGPKFKSQQSYGGSQAVCDYSCLGSNTITQT